MNWIKNFVRPKIRSILGTDKREVPENMWVKDPDSGQMVFYKDLEANQFVFPNSGYHERMTAPVRLKHVMDNGEFERVPVPGVPGWKPTSTELGTYSGALPDVAVSVVATVADVPSTVRYIPPSPRAASSSVLIDTAIRFNVRCSRAKYSSSAI